LGGQLRAHIRQLAEVVKPHAGRLDRKFVAGLRSQGFDPRQRKALAAITAGAAVRILTAGRPLAEFFEQVEYNGRRLAKLDLRRGAVLEALGRYDRLLSEVLRKDKTAEYANLRWACDQLGFCVALTLNNAFYQVRESETQAFFDLFQAELVSRSQRELLERSLQTLTRFCGADAGLLILFDRKRRSYLSIAEPKPAAVPVPGAKSLPRELSRPREFSICRKLGKLLMDPAWRTYGTCWSIPLKAGSRTAGVMQFAFGKAYAWMPRERQLLAGAAERCLLASEKLRLAEDLAEREERIRELASNMFEVEERERQRISRELHDEAGQLLLYLRLQLDVIEHSLPPELTDLRSKLVEARDVMGRTVIEIRRIISDLSPAVLEQLGLPAAVRQLANRLRHLNGIQVRLKIPRLGRLPKNTELIVYRLVQECCSNIARHSGASHINIFLSFAERMLRLRVEDDGVGFHVEQALEKRGSFGMAGMKERVALAGGEFQVESRPGHGTRVTISLPVLERPETVSVPRRLKRVMANAV
jgi:signal transduction histidine kinase